MRDVSRNSHEVRVDANPAPSDDASNERFVPQKGTFKVYPRTGQDASSRRLSRAMHRAVTMDCGPNGEV
ncbi:MAG: hypothetical protein R3B91_17095 [Planctomycetaceae bacterium]